MDFEEELCKKCGEITVELLDCPHTDTLCPLRDSIFAGNPFTHRVIVTPPEQISSATGESAKPKVKKQPKPSKSPKSTDDWAMDDLTEMFQHRVSHKCRSKAKQRKRPVPMPIPTGTAADSTPNEPQENPDQLGAEKRPKSDRFWLKKPSVDHTGEKRLATSDSIDPPSKAKRPPMEINSGGKKLELSSEQQAKQHDFRLLINQTIVALLQKDLANLPINSTATQENLVEKQIESEEEVKNNLDPVALSNEPAKSDSSDEANSHPSETRNDAADIDEKIRKLSDHIGKTSASRLLTQIVDLMRNNLDNSQVLIGCKELIDRYDFVTLRRLDSLLFRRLIDVSLSAMKCHSKNSEIVDGFCRLASSMLDKIGVGWDGCQIDWFLESIDFLLEIGCGENMLTPTALWSTLQLVEKVIEESDVDQRKLIGQMSVVEKLCQSIKSQLESDNYDSTYDDYIMLMRIECLPRICQGSAANQTKFLNAGGLRLLQDCLKLDYGGWWLSSVAHSASLLMDQLNLEEAILPELMRHGNPEILWEMWADPYCRDIHPCCRQIFTNFLSGSPLTWPFAQPTMEEVKMELNPTFEC